MLFKPSYYNLMVRHGALDLLFNGVSSGLLKLPCELAKELGPLLGHQRSRDAGVGLRDWKYPVFEEASLPTWARERFGDLKGGRFFIPAHVDEQQLLKERFEYGRRNSPILVTITTTMDCNLGCYYCYEAKNKDYLTPDGCDAILDWIHAKIRTNKHERVVTDWYGGEPMLNQEAIEHFSTRVIALCENENIDYSSSMISNGTRWPQDAKGFVERNRIRHLQLTLDGPRDHHNKRRRYVDTNENPAGSFDTVLETIDRLIGSVRIYLRINVDPWIGRSALGLLELFEQRGWLEKGNRFYPYVASIGPMTEHCSFLEESNNAHEVQDEFVTLKHEFHEELAAKTDSRGMEHLQYYPRTKIINCGAVNDNAVVFGPKGEMYKCGLEVGDFGKAHDQLQIGSLQKSANGSQLLPILQPVPEQHDPNRWSNYDPFTHQKCGQCQYLPVCLGGCPKAQIDRNEYYLKLQSEHWENNFDRIIRNYVDAAGSDALRHGG